MLPFDILVYSHNTINNNTIEIVDNSRGVIKNDEYEFITPLLLNQGFCW